MMANGAIKEDAELLCPIIDARRMEVFTAIYNKSLNELVAPHNCILSNESFDAFLDRRIIFFGNGSLKFKELIFHPNAIFKELVTTAEQMVSLSYSSFVKSSFEDLAYCEPFYGKEFYSPGIRVI
jgi:tRNA threonylcarbamoyladenosine biosynthesis protein TsaB